MLLFQIFTEREERKATAVATNSPFAEWDKIFGDPRLCAAIADRITFRATLICGVLAGRSGRAVAGGFSLRHRVLPLPGHDCGGEQAQAVTSGSPRMPPRPLEAPVDMDADPYARRPWRE
ncbi:ATP-binding protein [Streptomyces mordarskii]|uniref:IstB-like ATP-binding domain-containing protein n=1 Tax=Streptomyces mordarskii TaxID=1226758 RepID=A0ABP3NE48_9ACTN